MLATIIPLSRYELLCNSPVNAKAHSRIVGSNLMMCMLNSEILKIWKMNALVENMIVIKDSRHLISFMSLTVLKIRMPICYFMNENHPERVSFYKNWTRLILNFCNNLSGGTTLISFNLDSYSIRTFLISLKILSHYMSLVLFSRFIP